MTKTHNIVLIALLCLTGTQAQAAEPGRWERMKNYAHSEKEAAVEDGKKILAETDAKIAELKEQSKQSMDKVKSSQDDNMKTIKDNHEKNMQELQDKKAAAQAHLEKLQTSSGEAWQATREGFSGAFQSLHQAYEKAATAVKR